MSLRLQIHGTKYDMPSAALHNAIKRLQSQLADLRAGCSDCDVKKLLTAVEGRENQLQIAINKATHLICSDDDFGGPKQILGIQILEQALTQDKEQR